MVLRRNFDFGLCMITFLLNLAFELMKKLVQVGNKYGKWDVLFFDKFLFESIIGF